MTHRYRLTPIVGGFLLALGFSTFQPAVPALAQSSEIQQVRREIARMQREIATLRRQVGKRGGRSPRSIGGELPPTLAARMEVRLSQLEGEARRMTGKLEQVGHNLAQIKEKLDRAVSDIELRLAALEKGKPIAGGASARPRARSGNTARGGTARGKPRGGTRGRDTRKASGGGSSGTAGGSAGGSTARSGGGAGQGGGEQLARLPDGKPAEQYQYAMSLLRRGDHVKAAGALKAFIRRYPSGPLTGNAVYWLGEAYYVRGKYREAAIHFAEGFKKYPKSPKAPANLLKLGMSFGKLNKRAEACASLYELTRRYPRAPTYIRRRATGESRKLRCG